MAGWWDGGMATADGIARNGRTADWRNGGTAELVDRLILMEWPNGGMATYQIYLIYLRYTLTTPTPTPTPFNLL